MRRMDGSLGNVCILGLGKSGKSAASYCASLLGTRVESVFIAAGARNDASVEFVSSLAREGVEYAFGDDALTGLERTFDLCIASPGIPYWHELYVAGERISDEIISEIEFAWRESEPDSVWVAITGTNGKTTTTSCCAHVLSSCGFKAAAVGNIGDVCLDAVAAGETKVYVAELSSYQLASTKFFAPDVAVLLNITPDHIHWHKTLEAYRDAKFKVLDNLPTRPSAVAILDATNEVVRGKVRELKALAPEARGFSYIPMGSADGIESDMRVKCGAENAAFINGSALCVAYQDVEHKLIKADALQIKGSHNASNALAAAAVAVVLGARDEAIAEALAGFQPLEHRIEPCGTVRGIACFNDSKATNVDATLKALASFPGKRVVVLLGGQDKGTELDELVSSTLANASAAVCYGEAGPRFAEAFEGASGDFPEGFTLASAKSLEEALDCALSLALAGDVVLLSPACASFDEFDSFEHRGRRFKELVADRALRGEVR